jgi:hypothetical protein
MLKVEQSGSLWKNTGTAYFSVSNLMYGAGACAGSSCATWWPGMVGCGTWAGSTLTTAAPMLGTVAVTPPGVVCIVTCFQHSGRGGWLCGNHEND